MEEWHFYGRIMEKLVGGLMSSAAQEWSVQRMEFEVVLNFSEDGLQMESLNLTAPRAEVQGFVLENLEVAAVEQSLHQLHVVIFAQKYSLKI